jgi:hypothetical protein
MIKSHRTLIFSLIVLSLITLSTIAYAITVEISAEVVGCNDGIIGVGEQCDSTNLGGATCALRGFSYGVLSCTSVCTFNTSGCSTSNQNSGIGSQGGGSSYFESRPSSTNVVFSGKAYPKSVITLLKDAQVVSTTIAGSDATFQTTISGLSSGNYLFSIYAEDKDGVRSSLLTFPVSITSGVTTKIGGIYIAPSFSIDKAEVKKGDNISMFGQTTPSSEVLVSIHSEEEHFIRKKADLDGVYLINFDTSELEIGSHTAKSKVFYLDEISSYSKAIAFIVGNKNILNNKLVKTSYIGDVNKDGKVNLVDLSITSYWYKKPNPPSKVDVNGDGIVNLVDLSVLMFHWTG